MNLFSVDFSILLLFQVSFGSVCLSQGLLTSCEACTAQFRLQTLLQCRDK